VFGADCARRGSEWVLVMPPGARGPAWAQGEDVPRTESVAEALQHFVLSIHARRTMPLARGRADDAVSINWPGDADR
jgi:hypothetical protein